MKLSRSDTPESHDVAPVRVVVIDDHEMILQSVVRLLTADSGIDVVGTALTAGEGIELVTKLRPDVVVIDYLLPDMSATEAIKILLSVLPDVKVVTISGADRPGSFYESMRAGSSAWVRKTRAIQELRLAIHSVALGEPYVSEESEVQPKLDELVVHYQPIVSLDTWRIVGFEALVRWQHPERGLQFPESFLPHMIETGFVEEIDRWVVQQATRQLALWHEKLPSRSEVFISVNMSSNTLSNPGLSEFVAEELRHSGLRQKDLVIELKELFLVTEHEGTVELLAKLRAVGGRLAVADFGASFSQISYIHKIPFDFVKIGRSLTRELPGSSGTAWHVDSVATVAQSMSTACIAEGIETMAQLDALRSIGVNFGQGFLFSPAVRAAVCEALLAQPSLLPLSATASATPRLA